jgi:hemolysin III
MGLVMWDGSKSYAPTAAMDQPSLSVRLGSAGGLCAQWRPAHDRFLFDLGDPYLVAMVGRRGCSNLPKTGARDSRQHDRRERIADAAVHGAGLALGLAGCLGLAAAALPSADPRRMAALALYAAGLLAMLGCSALYNLASEGEGAPRKALLRRLDHAAIFLMIAGTYTPVALLGIGGAWGWGLLAVVWAGALGGAALKLLAPGRFERAAIAAYLLLGWAGLAALDPLLAALPPRDLGLLVAGGVLYSLGVAVHLATRLPFHNALWHAFVLAAAACHYAVVLRLAAAAAPAG